MDGFHLPHPAHKAARGWGTRRIYFVAFVNTLVQSQHARRSYAEYFASRLCCGLGKTPQIQHNALDSAVMCDSLCLLSIPNLPSDASIATRLSCRACTLCYWGRAARADRPKLPLPKVWTSLLFRRTDQFYSGGWYLEEIVHPEVCKLQLRKVAVRRGLGSD